MAGFQCTPFKIDQNRSIDIISRKINPFTQKRSAILREDHVYFDLLAYLSLKLLKNWRNPNVGW